MPRSIWSGSISFGLVNVPVRLYSAVQEHKLRFHFVHEKDSSPIGYEKICKKEGKPVPDDEIVKAFEFEKGEYVFMEEEDFAAAQGRGLQDDRHRRLRARTRTSTRSTSRTRTTSGPTAARRRPTRCSSRRWRTPSSPAIAKFVMRDRQHLGALRIRDGVITLEQLYFADEIRDVEEIKASTRRASRPRS